MRDTLQAACYVLWRQACRKCLDVTDRGEEVWAEVGDGSCRWRQTASEVTLLCLGVPPHTPAKQLQVTLDPYFIKGTVLPFIIHFPSFSVVMKGHLPKSNIKPEPHVAFFSLQHAACAYILSVLQARCHSSIVIGA